MADSTSRRSWAILLVAASALLWSTGGLGVKLIELPAWSLAGYRSLVAAVTMSLVIVARARRARAEILPLLRRPLVHLAAVAYAVMVVAFVVAAKMTTVANAIFIQYTGPIYVALFSGPLLGERPSRRDWLAIVGCLLGMAIFFSEKMDRGALVGNLVAIVSSFGFGALPVLLRRDLLTLPPEEEGGPPPALVGMLAMVLGNFVAVLVCSPSMVQHPPTKVVEGLAIVALGALQIGLPYVLYGLAVPHLRALESSLVAMLEPILSPVWAFLGAHESPTPTVLVGGAVILASVVGLVGLRDRR